MEVWQHTVLFEEARGEIFDDAELDRHENGRRAGNFGAAA
jgi:hypothetical protein